MSQRAHLPSEKLSLSLCLRLVQGVPAYVIGGSMVIAVAAYRALRRLSISSAIARASGGTIDHNDINITLKGNC